MRLRRGDTGEVAQEFYKGTDGTVTMTDEHGEALRDDNSGQRITVRLGPGCCCCVHADDGRRYREENRDEMASFHTRPLRYLSRCWA
jgi:hypothetical protein